MLFQNVRELGSSNKMIMMKMNNQFNQSEEDQSDQSNKCYCETTNNNTTEQQTKTTMKTSKQFI